MTDGWVTADISPARVVPDPPGVVYDFGRELFGSFVAVPAGGGRVRVSLGESWSEAVQGAFDDATFTAAPGRELRIDPTGFRFACVDPFDAPVELTGVRAVERRRRADRRVAFRSGDPVLDAVWEAAVRTVEVGMQEHLWDGAKRGRTVWAGDLYPAAAVVSAVFGPHPVVPQSLDEVRDRTFRGGRVDGWLNGIPAYTLWWVLTQRDWFRAHGDRAYLETQRAFLLAVLPDLVAAVGPDGREGLEGGWRFLDWATTRDPEAVAAGYQGLLKLGLDAVAQLFDALGEPAAADARAAAGRLVGWEPPARSKAAWALMSLAGLVEPGAAAAALTAEPVAGVTPFLGAVVLDALTALGRADAAEGLIRRLWGAMIDLGATT
ncbi:MAG TPA: hypothetical protein VH092_19025, partial [Urbifossiella sp.]|nr:hypothetical protein [Urbifossiella sp.]